MSLKGYIKKRTPLSPEPPGRVSNKHSHLSFTIQKHDASHLHYDFRLECNGVLKSWAIPKGPSINPNIKRLAIMVEDHPYDYRLFEGTIPQGNYGAGTVMVWDEGVYYPLDESNQIGTEKSVQEGLNKGNISFILNGDKIKGLFSLIKLKKNPKNNHWLLVKGKDKYCSSTDILKEDLSVISGRSMDEISLGHIVKSQEKLKNSNKQNKQKEKKNTKTPPIKIPKKIKPMLASLTDKPFDSKKWLFEIKWDGYRAIAEIQNQKINLYSRNFLSFNTRYAPIIEALKELHCSAVLDGEVVVLDKNGKAHFQDLQNYQKSGIGDLVYCIFDLLYYEGSDYRNLPLIERKEKLKELLPLNHPILRYSDHVIGQGKKLFSLAKKQKLEGIVAKETQSKYLSKRSHSWLKIKTRLRQEAIICGFTQPRGGRQKFGSLILGVYENRKLHYIGHVGGGFDDKALINIFSLLEPLTITKCPFQTQPETNTPATWVKPKLICEISFTEWTKERSMRHPIFLGIREDKKPMEVHLEMSPQNKNKSKEKNTPLSSKKTSSSDVELHLTHLDKIFWPSKGITKGDLIDYYRKIKPFILPYLIDRAESLRRYPNGIEENGFFQKNMATSLPHGIQTVKIKKNENEVRYLVIQDEKSLLYAINLGCIDLNPFNARITNLDYPDYLVLDLDPENISFSSVIETALQIHQILEEAKIPNYCKTSGSRGLHIYIPMNALYTFEQTKNFAQLLAEMTHKKLPTITSLERSPQKRQKKVYIDYLQNKFGATMASPYSVRPNNEATVSTPLQWPEVNSDLDPHAFTMNTIFDRLKKKDPFLPVLGKGINLIHALKNLENLLNN